ncbi:alpha-mannosidase [candidate division KSB1 bacterium]|nr:alpha-mannosidase [candidate division KSB1 bacterium]
MKKLILSLLIFSLSIPVTTQLNASQLAGIVSEFLVLGGFSFKSEKDQPLFTDYAIGEADIAPFEGQVSAAKIWQKMSASFNGQLDFEIQEITPYDNSTVYAHVYVKLPQSQKVLLLAGSDDGLAIFANGVLVHYNHIYRGWRLDQDKVEIALAEGWNRILCKVFNGRGGFGLSLRLVNPDGTPIDGIEFSAHNPATPPESFATPIIPADYRLKEISLAPEMRLSKKGELEAVIQGVVFNYGNQKASRLQIELNGSKMKKQLVKLSTAPLERNFKFYVPFDDAAKSALENLTLDFKLQADTAERIYSLSINPDDLLLRFFSPIQIVSDIIETDEKIHVSERIEIPKLLSRMPLALLLPLVEVERFNINNKPASALDPGSKALNYINLDEYQPYNAGITKNRLAFDLSYSKKETDDENIVPRLQIVASDYLKLKYNIEYAAILQREGFDVPEIAGSQLLEALLSGKKEKFDRALGLANQQIAQASNKIKANTIHLVGNAHIDLAWLWPWTETVDVCRETFENAIKLMEAHPDFTYAQSQAQSYEWMEKCYPDLFERIKQMVAAGKWIIVNGMWTEPDSNLPSGEAFVRQILYGQRYFKEKFGITTNVAWTPDTFGYAWTLPQIYKKAGFDFFVTTKIWWNDVTKPEHHLFKWEAPDGSQIITFLPEGYGSDPTSNNVLDRFKRYQANTNQSDLMVLYGKGDHGGGPSESMLTDINIMANVDYFPTVKLSTPNRFFEAIETSGLELPVLRDEMYLEYHRGCYTTQAKVKKYNRQMECLLETAEKFAAFSGMPYPKQQLDDAWKRTLFNQFHDILPGSSIPIVYEHAHASYDTAITETQHVINAAMESIANKINTRGFGTPVIVFNPLSWIRSDAVTLDLPQRFRNKELRVTDEERWVVKSQSIDGNKLLFEAENVPPLGYKVFFIQIGKTRQPKDKPVATQWKIKSNRFEIKFDEKTGNLKSIYDLKHKREVLAGAGNELQFFEDIPEQYDAWNIGYTGKRWVGDESPEMKIVENGAVRATIRVVRKTGNSRFAQDISLYRANPVIEIKTVADWHESHVLAKAAFQLAVKNDLATYEIPYGTIQRTTIPKTAADSAKYEVSAHKWIDLTDKSGTYGVSLLNDSKYGFDIIRESNMRITLLRSPKSPDPNADMGQHTFTYCLYPHSGDWRAAETYQRGYELNYPLKAIIGDDHSGQLPKSQSFIQLEDAPGVAITTVKKAEAADDLILRLVEIYGKHSEVTLNFLTPVTKARPVNLLEEPISGEIITIGNQVKLKMKPNEIKTIALELE